MFQGLPGPELLARLTAFLWFFLLFIAGITSAVAQASPAISFMQENFRVRRRSAVRILVGAALVIGMLHVVFFQHGFLDEWDYWAGTFGLVIFAAIEIVLFSFVFGIDRGWDELHRGADLKIPAIYRPIMKWVTPAFLYTLLIWWGVTEAVPAFLMDGKDPADIPYLWLSRGVMLVLLVVCVLAIRRAWRAERGAVS